MKLSVLLSVPFISSFLLMTGCEQKVDPTRMKGGKELYDYYCMDCHKNKGPGAEMEHLANNEPMKPYKIILMIKYGYDMGHSMPVFDQLSEEQADTVARYTVELQRKHQK